MGVVAEKNKKLISWCWLDISLIKDKIKFEFQRLYSMSHFNKQKNFMFNLVEIGKVIFALKNSNEEKFLIHFLQSNLVKFVLCKIHYKTWKLNIQAVLFDSRHEISYLIKWMFSLLEPLFIFLSFDHLVSSKISDSYNLLWELH